MLFFDPKQLPRVLGDYPETGFGEVWALNSHLDDKRGNRTSENVP